MVPEILTVGYLLQHQKNKNVPVIASVTLPEMYTNNKDKLPLLDKDKLKSLKNTHLPTINGNSESVQLYGSPTGHFLAKMENSVSETYRELKPFLKSDSDRTIITCNRKVLQEIINQGSFFDLNKNQINLNLKLKTKYGSETYGSSQLKVLRLGLDISKQSGNKTKVGDGIVFENCLLQGNVDRDRDYKLFSIHCILLNKKFALFYEADVDAILVDNNQLKICEIKLAFLKHQNEIKTAFDIYSKLTNADDSTTKSSLKEKIDEYNYKNGLRLPLTQGELGRVNHFIYGFYKVESTRNKNQVEKRITGIVKYDCSPALTLDDSHVKLFLEENKEKLLQSSDTWKFYTLKFTKDGCILNN